MFVFPTFRFHAQHHASTYESRMWRGKENCLQDVPKEVPSQMELGTAPKKSSFG